MDFPFVFTDTKAPMFLGYRCKCNNDKTHSSSVTTTNLLAQGFSKLADFCARCVFSIIWWLHLNRQNNWTSQSIWKPLLLHESARAHTGTFICYLTIAVCVSVTVYFRIRFGDSKIDYRIYISPSSFTLFLFPSLVSMTMKRKIANYRQTGNKIRCVNYEPMKRRKKGPHELWHARQSIQCIDQDECNFTPTDCEMIIACARFDHTKIASYSHTQGRKQFM